MAVILRTAGQERSKAEIKRDYEYVMRTWDTIRDKTLESSAPALIHEEANLIRRSIRDLYTKDIDEILVAGEEGYRVAKDFMKAMIPSHAKKVQPYKDDQNVPMYQRFQVESQLNQIFDPVVQLRSGGSIVMHQTEALVAIDVNSGRATRERHIEETALKTNLEAAEEIARQLRLRDLAGLVVIDFIDMEENRNDHAVERKLKEALRRDRARIQVGRISPFGLLEMSRQRLRPSLLEAMTAPCPTCGGIGHIPSTESTALRVLRSVEEEGLRRRSRQITVRVPPSVALYVLNNKRATLAEMEENYGMQVVIETDDAFIPPHFILSRIAGDADEAAEPQQVTAPEKSASDDSEEQGRSSRRRGRGRRRKRRFEEGEEDQNTGQEASKETDADSGSSAEGDRQEASSDEDGEQGQRKRRKRGRRGGRKRRNQENDAQAAESGATDTDGQTESGADGETTEQPQPDAPAEAVAEDATAPESADAEEQKPRRRRSPRRRSGSKKAGSHSRMKRRKPLAKLDQAEVASVADEQATQAPDAENQSSAGPDTSAAVADEEKPAKPKRTRRPRKSAAKKAAAAKAAEPETANSDADAPAEAEPAPVAVTPAPAMAEAAPSAPAVEEAANDANGEEAEAEDPNKPKRKGWWNRITGS